MVNVTCCKCSMVFGMPDELYRLRQEDGKGFTCTNGHNMVFSPSENKTLKKELKRARDGRDNYKRWWLERGDDIDRLVRQRSALRGVVTKLKMKLYPERYK